ncbi:hypothetical protein ACIBEA_39540 [Streptomyces sp. NPDC051555]|uniref:hypothetical protein n=1 Tax=Streptomyces sp. NPDC051555 TaxID=3365657 RepID=UPI0037AD7BC1
MSAPRGSASRPGDRARERRRGGPGRRAGRVRAVFRPGELPGVAVAGPPRLVRVAGSAAARALAEAGLGHLGGRLEVHAYDRAPRPGALAHAARRAVALALRGARSTPAGASSSPFPSTPHRSGA